MLRDPQGRRRWATPEVGGSGSLKLSLSKTAAWNSQEGAEAIVGTWAAENPGARLKVADDGKIKLLNRDSQIIWKARKHEKNTSDYDTRTLGREVTYKLVRGFLWEGLFTTRGPGLASAPGCWLGALYTPASRG